MAADFKAGSTFDTWEDFFKAFELYKEVTYQPFVKYSNRTIETANRRIKEGHMKYPKLAGLNFAQVEYRCVHRGIHKPHGLGLRRSRSFKFGCPARIYASLDKGSGKVFLKVVNAEHNHETGQEYFSHYPMQRLLPKKYEVTIAGLCKQNISGKKLHQHIKEHFGKDLTSNDIRNLKHRLRASKSISMEEINERLREAACVGDVDLLSRLLAQGASINSKNAMNGWTPLHWACKRNHVAVVQHLVSQGADKTILNKDGQQPSQLCSSGEIVQLLGGEAGSQVNSALPITPNYLANPVFPYNSDTRQSPYRPPTTGRDGGDSQSSTSLVKGNENVDEIVLKVRLANSDERDFIEVELKRPNRTYGILLNTMCAELGVDKALVAKIRKLPDTIVRKDKDVLRLHDYQELELVLTNKATSAMSRTYSLEPVKNHETILY